MNSSFPCPHCGTIRPNGRACSCDAFQRELEEQHRRMCDGDILDVGNRKDRRAGLRAENKRLRAEIRQLRGEA